MGWTFIFLDRSHYYEKYRVRGKKIHKRYEKLTDIRHRQITFHLLV